MKDQVYRAILDSRRVSLSHWAKVHIRRPTVRGLTLCGLVTIGFVDPPRGQTCSKCQRAFDRELTS